jgi:hypothetical protein
VVIEWGWKSVCLKRDLSNGLLWNPVESGYVCVGLVLGSGPSGICGARSE